MDELPPGYLQRLFEIESSGNRYTIKGSYRGLGQFSRELERRYGIADWTDPAQQARAVAREVAEHRPALTRALGRDPTPGELYLSHQQGLTGAQALLGDPDRPAWQVVRPSYPDWLAKQRGFASGDDMARAAIKGNIPGNNPLSSVDPDKITARDYGKLWISKFEGTDQPIPLPRPRPPSVPRGSLDQPQNDLADGGALPAPSDLFGPPPPSLADGEGAFPAALSQMQTAPQQVPAPSASPIDVPVPPALQPLVPFFFPRGLNIQSPQAWPSTGAADGPDTPGLYNGPLPRARSSPTGQFGGALMPGGPFDALQVNRANNSNALAAFPLQTQTTARQAPAPAPIDVALPPALRRLVPLFFGSPTEFGRGLSAPVATAEMTPQADQVRRTGGLPAPSGGAQITSQQARAPSPPWIDLVPPELRILVPFFFPQGFDNG